MVLKKNTSAGFTLIETVVSVTIFTIIFLAVYATYVKLFDLIAVSRVRSVAMALANERIEVIRNLSYANVGTLTGIPRGLIDPSETFVRNNISFDVTTVIRNIDDPFDGLLGGTPNDTAPADYKFVDVTVACPSCENVSSFSVATFVAPKNLEISSTTNGALFINVVDGSGLPVSGASVHVENGSTTFPIVIDDSTNVNGMLQLVDIPPGVETYQITVTKDGYTTDMTRSRGAVGNPNPIKPHATVAAETVTAITMSIDRASVFHLRSMTQSCTPIPDFDFSFSGSKLIGTSPDVKLYEATLETDETGHKQLNDVVWDTYTLNVIDAAYQLIGTNALSPVVLLPGETKNVDFIVSAKNPRSLMVTVKDGATSLPISGTSVRLVGGAVDETLITGRGFLAQTDWSGGAGQATTTDTTRYFSSDGSVSVHSSVGEVRLRDTFGVYDSAGELISSAFDTGSVSNFHDLSWWPTSQLPETGLQSVRFQLASNNDGGTWNFIGPDGTSATYYEIGTTTIHASHSGDRYIRYKLLLSTASTSFTPNVSDVAFTFTSDCVAPGQVTFDGLASGDYELSVSKEGYTTQVATTTISSDWQPVEVVLTP